MRWTNSIFDLPWECAAIWFEEICNDVNYWEVCAEPRKKHYASKSYYSKVDYKFVFAGAWY